MKTNTIITIGRQYGSAGREIGYKIADDLGIKLVTIPPAAAQMMTKASIPYFHID